MKVPIVALSATEWEETSWGVWQQLLSRLAARGWPVAYSNGPLSVWERERPRWQRAGWVGDFVDTDGIRLDRPGVLGAYWPKAQGWERAAMARHARHLLRNCGIPGVEQGILLIFNPQFAPYAELMGLPYLVYFPIDVYALIPNWLPEYADHEARLVEHADLVLASSEAIGRSLPGCGPSRFVRIENGADAAIFAAAADEGAACPPDLAEVPRPRIGYVGRITPKVDFHMIAELAQLRPGRHWVLVGPVIANPTGITDMEQRALAGLARCRGLPNVHFLGEKRPDELPSYMAHMDVNTICYRPGGGWWVAGYPLKLHEYLAIGKPVVSSRLDMIDHFAAVVDIAVSTDDWRHAIDRALEQGGVGTPVERRRVAFANSWDRRVDRLEELFGGLIDRPLRHSHPVRRAVRNGREA